MILATKDKSPFGGKDIFVPNFLHMSLKERNRIHNYAGRDLESEDQTLLSLLALPTIGFGLIGGIVIGLKMGYLIIAMMFPLLGLALLLGGVISVAVSIKWPKKPNTLIICHDDVRWSMLLVAFGDNQKLWERLSWTLKNGSYLWDSGLSHYKSHETPLMRELDDCVSAFMVCASPTVGDAQNVRIAVERIYAKHDQSKQEVAVVREVREEIEAAGKKQLFDFQVQMARADASRYAVTTDLLHHTTNAT